MISPLLKSQTEETRIYADKYRNIDFAGMKWHVMDYGAKIHGPGNNLWSKENVWVDENGFLHLLISKRKGKWYCAEVVSHEHASYGDYQFSFEFLDADQDPNLVFSTYLYVDRSGAEGVPEPDSLKEIDIEFTRWGDPNYPNTQYSIHCDAEIDDYHREWPFDKSMDFETAIVANEVYGTIIGWFEDQIEFQVSSPVNLLNRNGISKSTYDSSIGKDFNPDYIPDENNDLLRVHINYWLHSAKPPKNKKDFEVVIRDVKCPINKPSQE
jgi:hypothetical protein